MVERIEIGDCVRYQLNDKLHRPNGPAVEWPKFGHWDWYFNDEWHRYYGPQEDSGEWWVHDTHVK